MIATYTKCLPQKKASAWDIWQFQEQLWKTSNDPNLVMTSSNSYYGDIWCSICGGIICTHLNPPQPIMVFIL